MWLGYCFWRKFSSHTHVMQICLCFNLFVFLTAKRKESNIYLVLHHRILKIFLLVSAHSNWCTITKVMVCTVLSVGRKYTILNLCYRNIYLRKEMFYLTTHSTHFMYGNWRMSSSGFPVTNLMLKTLIAANISMISVYRVGLKKCTLYH